MSNKPENKQTPVSTVTTAGTEASVLILEALAKAGHDSYLTTPTDGQYHRINTVASPRQTIDSVKAAGLYDLMVTLPRMISR